MTSRAKPPRSPAPKTRHGGSRVQAPTQSKGTGGSKSAQRGQAKSQTKNRAKNTAPPDALEPTQRRAGSAVRTLAPKPVSKTAGPAEDGDRALKVRVATAKGRRLSSTRWLQRQLNDPYVSAAKRAGYRSRAAFKLIELDDRFGLLKKGGRVLDLGAAPGGWTQVAVERAGADLVVGIDVLEMDPVPGALLAQMDFLDEDAPERLMAMIGGPVHAVLSDMAAPATGHRPTDHLRIVSLCELALAFARTVLAPGGVFCAKVLQGGTESGLLTDMKRDFTTVRHAKPDASRAGSAEMYVLAQGFRARGFRAKGLRAKGFKTEGDEAQTDPDRCDTAAPDTSPDPSLDAGD